MSALGLWNCVFRGDGACAAEGCKRKNLLFPHAGGGLARQCSIAIDMDLHDVRRKYIRR